MADSHSDARPARSRALYAGPVVVAGVAVASVLDAGVAAALGSGVMARLSLQTAVACGCAAVASLAYVLRRIRKTPR